MLVRNVPYNIECPSSSNEYGIKLFLLFFPHNYSRVISSIHAKQDLHLKCNQYYIDASRKCWRVGIPFTRKESLAFYVIIL